VRPTGAVATRRRIADVSLCVELAVRFAAEDVTFKENRRPTIRQKPTSGGLDVSTAQIAAASVPSWLQTLVRPDSDNGIDLPTNCGIIFHVPPLRALWRSLRHTFSHIKQEFVERLTRRSVTYVMDEYI